jgi:hypothetical protein
MILQRLLISVNLSRRIFAPPYLDVEVDAADDAAITQDEVVVDAENKAEVEPARKPLTADWNDSCINIHHRTEDKNENENESVPIPVFIFEVTSRFPGLAAYEVTAGQSAQLCVTVCSLLVFNET